jgi:hypothetical protein
LAHIGSRHGYAKAEALNDRKGKAQQVEWDRELEELRREKEAADAQRGEFTTDYRGHGYT